jgi:hypothetical protein
LSSPRRASRSIDCTTLWWPNERLVCRLGYQTARGSICGPCAIRGLPSWRLRKNR